MVTSPRHARKKKGLDRGGNPARDPIQGKKSKVNGAARRCVPRSWLNKQHPPLAYN
jgi:hypothetical protein